MSWLTDWADKAENFLNTLDTSAAQALQKPYENDKVYHKDKRSDPYIVKEFDNKAIADCSFEKSSKTFNAKINEDLFKFNISEDKVDVNIKQNLDNSDKASSGYRTNFDETDNVSSENAIDNNIMLENKLLRSEISSLNQEMSSLLQRNHKTEEELKRFKNQFDKISIQLRESDKINRQLLSEIDDLQETLKTKHSAILVLQAELEKTRHESIKNCRDTKLLPDEKNRLSVLEQELIDKSNQINILTREKSDLLNSTEDIKLKMAQSINSYVTKQGDDKRKIDFLNSQLNCSRQRMEHAQQELKDYKIKATKILNMKEKLIADLKGSTDNSGQVFTSSFELNNTTIDSQKIDELQNDLREECDKLREQISRSRVELEHKEFDLQELDQQFHSETESLRRNVDLLEEQLDREKQMREDIDVDYRQLNRELRQIQEKYSRDKSELDDIIASKDKQLEQFQLMSNQNNTSGLSFHPPDMEYRIRSLTDAILQKQAALDSSKADCCSLQSRLQQCELKLAQNQQMQHHSYQNSQLSMNSRNSAMTSDCFTINMGDPPVAKNCKIAMNGLDKVTKWFGVFFRRYPPARLLFLFYIVMLHFWVLFVFLTYSPEIHSAMSNRKGNSNNDNRN